jgi:uncharacterized protein YgiM (DUF1202 family)
MSTAAARLVVTRDYVAQYADPIALRMGDAVTVHRADTEYVGWYWCTNDSGKEGWVHESYLSAVHGQAAGIKDYTAAELSVRAGERVTFLDRSTGWVFVQRQDGAKGWVPETHVNAVD